MVIDILPEGKSFYLISTSKKDDILPSWLDGSDPIDVFMFDILSRDNKYFMIVKASSTRSAHTFAQNKLGKKVSFSTRKTSPGFVSVMTDIDIYEAK